MLMEAVAPSQAVAFLCDVNYCLNFFPLLIFLVNIPIAHTDSHFVLMRNVRL